jgi:hypothetical protein
MLAFVPSGGVFAFGVIATDTSLGAATVSVGISGSAAKYSAAATLTAPNAPRMLGQAAAVGMSALLYEEQIFLQVLGANLPSSGNLVVDLYFTFAN